MTPWSFCRRGRQLSRIYCIKCFKYSTEESGVADEGDGDADHDTPPENDEETPMENRFPEERRAVDPEYQAEYERLLAQLRESRRQLGEELTIDPERKYRLFTLVQGVLLKYM